MTEKLTDLEADALKLSADVQESLWKVLQRANLPRSVISHAALSVTGTLFEEMLLEDSSRLPMLLDMLDILRAHLTAVTDANGVAH
jgi:hypothetical protein